MTSAAVLFAGLLAGVLLTGVVGCSDDSPPPPKPEERSNRENTPSIKMPITEVRQTLNLGYTDLLRKIVASLGARRLSVGAINESAGTVETGWLNTHDKLCNMIPSNQAPLPCRMRLLFKVEGISGISSALRIKYEEICTFNEELRLECPESSAERLLLQLLGDIKSLDPSVSPVHTPPDGR